MNIKDMRHQDLILEGQKAFLFGLQKKDNPYPFGLSNAFYWNVGYTREYYNRYGVYP